MIINSVQNYFCFKSPLCKEGIFYMRLKKGGYMQNQVQNTQNQQTTGVNEVSPDMKKTYEQIFNTYGVDSANNWLKQQLLNNHVNLQADNDAVMKEIQAKYAEIYAVPAVKDAIQAYIAMDLNPSISLRDQGFHQVADYIAAIYKAGYDSAMGFKNQNDAAKARMSSAVNSAIPNYQGSRAFTRADIRAMSPEEFMRNEKAIFEQLNQGLIK